MKHLIKTTILMLAILLPAILHASQSFPVGFAKEMFAVALPEAPEITIDTTDAAVIIGASDVEGADVVLYQCDDEIGSNPRVIDNPSAYAREHENYTVYVYAVATNEAGSTQSEIDMVVIPAKESEDYDYTNGRPAEFELDGFYYYRNGDGVTVTHGSTYYSYGNYSGNVIIPETITRHGETYSVTAIGASAFRNCSGLTSITIPSSITMIGAYAFMGCSELSRVNITDLNAWFNTSFYDKSANPLYYAHHLFVNETEITELTFPDSLNSIGNYVFSGCNGLTSVTIPSSITSIGSGAFLGCSGLTSIYIPASVTSIGNGALSYCTGLTTINVDRSNPIYDSRDNCNAIIHTSEYTSESEIIVGCKNTVIPYSVSSISGMYEIQMQSSNGFYYSDYAGYGAFSGINMDSITIPATITNIGHGAFSGSYIKTINFNSSCTGLDGSSHHYIKRYPFGGCRADEFVIGSNVTEIWPDIAPYSSFSNIIIPNTVTSIGYEAFMKSNVKTAIFPNSITHLDNNAFFGCDNLTTIYLVGEGEWETESLPNTVTDLYIDAGLTSVKGMAVQPTDVYCYAITPPQCNDYSFTDYSGTLHVPASSIASYFTAPYWCNFANIVGDIEGPNSIALNEDSIEIKIGKTFNLTANVEPANTDFDSFIMWQSSDNNIAIVNNGHITVVGEGECDITVSCLGKKAICHVTTFGSISLSLDQTEVTIEKDKSITLTATILPENESGLPIIWTSNNTEVAIVDNGLVIAVEEGECDITASCLWVKAVCHVIVTKAKITITLDKDTVMVLPNHIITLTPSATPVMPEAFTASSSDPTVAAPRIMNGKVQVVGIKEGTATITVGSAEGPTVPATCLVTVYTEPGDINCDGFIRISDVTSLINYLLSGDDSSIKIENADLNVDGKVAIGDVTALINILLTTEAE